MSSGLLTLESVVASILDNNYVTLVILTAIGYDYILTFSSEIEYIWNKPWTKVSTLFLLVRYFGLCGVIVYTLVGSSFLPGPEKSEGETLPMVGSWTMFVFIASADLVMILRVWALYSRSRIILGILLALYIAEIIPYVVACIILVTPGKFTATFVQVLSFSFCASESGLPAWAVLNDSVQFALAVVMCFLVIARFIRESLQTYRSTRGLELSRYTNLFAREGILYFLAMLLFQLINVLALAANINTTGWRALVIGTLEYVPVFTLTPRFILNMRALYAHDTQGRRGPSDMDTGFGLSMMSGNGIGDDGMVFANAGRDEEGLQQGEEIPMEERATWNAKSDA